MNHAEFQRAFWHDLWSADGAPSSSWARQPGFAVYRNTVLKGCVDNLLALYPAVRRLTGDDWLGALALIHAREHPPRSGCMASYGRDLAAHLAQALPEGDLPWLPEVARLDALWNESHAAADAAVLDPAVLASVDATALPQTRLVPHPAARCHVCSAWPAFSLWRAAREAWPDPNPPRWRGEHTLLTRPGGTVLAMEASAGACALLDACARGLPITEAMASALATEPGIDLAATLGVLISQGAFTAMTT